MPDQQIPTEAKKAVGGDHDRVVMASRLPDGSPHQTPGFEYIGDKQVAVEAAKRQLVEQAVSPKDVELRGASAGPAAAGEAEPDAEGKKLLEAHQAAAKGAEKAAESEVNAAYKD